MPYRSRKENKPYKRHTKKIQKQAGRCQFCEITTADDVFIEESHHFFVIKNLFPYSYWDYKKVTDHLLVVPKKHTDTVSDFSLEESAEYVRLLGAYESRNYNVYARAPGSGTKSVVHQHTHLIKTHGKVVKFLLYLKRPYLRFTR